MIRKSIIVVLTFLAVVTTVLGAASFYRKDLSYVRGYAETPCWWRVRRCTLDRGQLFMELESLHEDEPDESGMGVGREPGGRSFFNVPLNLNPSRWSRMLRWAGFSFKLLRGWNFDVGVKAQSDQLFVDVPVWFVFLVCAAYPATAFIRGPLRRWHRRRRGLCLGCGYNLEGNVSGVCSECGVAR